MGRIKSSAVKSLGKELMKEHGDKFSNTFEKNKEALGNIKRIKSKKIRNVIAGYITKKTKTPKKKIAAETTETPEQ